MTKQRLKLTHQQRERFRRIRRLQQLKSMDPIEFEYFVGYLYERDGYRAYTTVTSGDEGVDLFLRKGTRSAIVQCKRYAGTVGQPTVRDLYGALIHNSANEAMLVTSGTISRPAEQWAAGKPLQLIDGHELISWARRSRLASSGSRLPWSMMGGVAAVAVLLLLCGGLIWFGSQQSWFGGNGNETPVLTVPTPGGTPDPQTAVDDRDDTNIVPTVTLPPTAVPLPNQAEVNAIALGNGRAPTVDARLNDWPAVATYAVPHRVYQVASWDGTEDLAATWQVAWNREALWLAINVVDDTHVQTQTGERIYQGDSIELQIDTDVLGDYGAGLNSDDFQILLSPGNFNQLSPSSYRFQAGVAANERNQIEVAAAPTTKGYIIEARILWQTLAMTPAENLNLGFALSVNDNDTAGTAVQEVMYAHVATRQLRDPSSWGVLLLAPN